MAKTNVRYGSEITSMMVTFGVKEPEEDAIRYIEDIVKSQLCDLVMAARDTATRRGSRAVQTEDIAFLLRHDATRLARIRAFLAWKDWTKRGLDFDQEEGDLLEELCNQHMASPRVPANWSWSAVEAAGEGAREDDERFIDRDHLAAFAGSVERLRGEQKLVEVMPPSEYQQYADGKQASFTYKRTKKFREFIGIGTSVDATMMEDVADVLGFIAHETVRQLCETGLVAPPRPGKKPSSTLSTASKASSKTAMPPPPVPLKRSRTIDGAASSPIKSEASSPSTSKRPKLEPTLSDISPSSSAFGTPRTLSYIGHHALASPSPPAGPFSLRQPSPPPPSAPSSTSSAPAPVTKLLTMQRKPLGVREIDDALLLLSAAQHRPRCAALRKGQRGWSMGKFRYS